MKFAGIQCLLLVAMGCSYGQDSIETGRFVAVPGMGYGSAGSLDKETSYLTEQGIRYGVRSERSGFTVMSFLGVLQKLNGGESNEIAVVASEGGSAEIVFSVQPNAEVSAGQSVVVYTFLSNPVFLQDVLNVAKDGNELPGLIFQLSRTKTPRVQPFLAFFELVGAAGVRGPEPAKGFLRYVGLSRLGREGRNISTWLVSRWDEWHFKYHWFMVHPSDVMSAMKGDIKGDMPLNGAE